MGCRRCALAMLVIFVLHACGGSDSPTAPTQTPAPTPAPAPTTPPPAPAPAPKSMTITVTITSGTAMFRGNDIQAGGQMANVGIFGQATVGVQAGQPEDELLDFVSLVIGGVVLPATTFETTVDFGTVNSSATQAFEVAGTSTWPLGPLVATGVTVFGTGIDPLTGDTVTQTNDPFDVRSDQVAVVHSPCVQSDTMACLHDGRFDVTAEFVGADGETRPAEVVGSGSVSALIDDVLFRSAFDMEGNLRAEVINNCVQNGHWGVVIELLSGGPFNMTILDTATGVFEDFSSLEPEPPEEFSDPMAFETCP